MDLLDLKTTTSRGVRRRGRQRFIATEAWAWTGLKAFDLAGGWTRIAHHSEHGPVTLELYNLTSGDAVSVTLAPGASRLVRLSPGRVEPRLWFGPGPGEVWIQSLTLTPVGGLSLWADHLRRALLILASGDLGRLKRAASAAMQPDLPLSLRPKAATLPDRPEPPGRPLRFGVRIEGREGRDVTLTSLDAQGHKDWMNWTPAEALEDRPDLWLTLKAGDRLAPDALAQLALRFDDPQVKAVYADETGGTRQTFKPGWDPEFLSHADYIGRPVAWRDDGREPPALDRTVDRLTVLAAQEGAEAIDRLALPLLTRAEPLDLPPRPEPWTPDWTGRISVIVPTRDRPDLLGPCLKGVLDDTDWPDLELILVDNGTRDPEALALMAARADDPRLTVLRIDEPFNYARLNNAAARVATGSILVLLNNDVEPLTRDWLARLARTAARPDVGAVGPLLFYPDRTVQHAGVALGIGGVAGHPWRGVPEAEVDTIPALAAPQRRSALTAACLVLRRAVFEAAGGFDETRFPITLNDVDLCLEIRERGLALIVDPAVRLIHHETKSRPSDLAPDQRARATAERNAFRAKWGAALIDDPYYSPALTRESETGHSRLA